MFEGFDSGPGWRDETDENKPPSPPWYMQVLGLVIVAAVIWIVYEEFKSL
jgi:hypothetical protein